MLCATSRIRQLRDLFQLSVRGRRNPSVPRPAARVASATSMIVEALEQRALFSSTFDPGDTFATALNLGDLNGQQTFNGTLNLNNLQDFYKFTMPRGGMFLNRFRTNTPGQEIELFREQLDAKGNPQEIQVAIQPTTLDNPHDGFASGDLAGRFLNAGTYYVEVSEQGTDTPYFMGITADYAGNSLKAARNVGSATDATFQDFVGNNPSTNLSDPSDLYKFKMDAPGQLTATMSLDNTDFTAFKAHISLIHDANGNGVIDPGDTLVQSGPATTATLTKNLAAGTYFVQVTSDLNSSNYHLHLNADYAGSTPGTTRAMGSLDTIKTFHDFISASTDKLDEYKFSVSSTRPVFLALSDTDDNGLIELALYKDSNNNGVADPSERVDASIVPHFDVITVTADPGSYIVQVQAEGTGQGTYQLSAETRPDGAGNTLKTARNLGTINGLTHVDDYVSDRDTTDFYKFTASASGTVGASIFTDFGGNVSLALIKDANNNGVVDKNELLSTAILASSGAKELSHSISAGNYFLRATSIDVDATVAKYFLSFQTDYAGSTPATARNVGTLSGTKSFDDWASGPFSGAISDIADVYKFSLSSTKTFSAKMIGVLDGQDLDLQLYRDKNNDGVLSSSELITSSHKLDSPNESFSKSLAAGTYYVKVVGVNGETNYHLTLKA